MKKTLVLLAILFVVVLAIVVGPRLSTEAMAVVVGAACGVVASIPVSLSLLLVLDRLPGLRAPSAPTPPPFILEIREAPPTSIIWEVPPTQAAR